MTDDPSLETLLAQEQQLILERFDLHIAWEIGGRLRAAAARAQLPVAIAMRVGQQQVFHAALPGSNADNDEWLARKIAVCQRYGHSSYYIGCQFRAEGRNFDTDSRLDPSLFAAHGGAFPLAVASAGQIGVVAVSGLPQVEDHAFVTEQLAAHIRESA